MRVEIWSDVVCPWCYIADARFSRALAEFPYKDQVEVVYRSFELDPGHDARHVEPVAAFLARRFGPQGPAMDDQVAVRARRDGLDYRTDRQLGSTLDAHRLLHLAKAQGRQRQLLALLYGNNFGEAKTIFGRDALLDLAVQAGLDGDLVVELLDNADLYLDAVRQDEREAGRLGAQGVPFVVFDNGRSLSGAQSARAYREALDSAWEARSLGGPDQDGGFCVADGECATPAPELTTD